MSIGMRLSLPLYCFDFSNGTMTWTSCFVSPEYGIAHDSSDCVT